MSTPFKIIVFFIASASIFFLLRTQNQYINGVLPILIDNLGGVTYLYSTIGVIFAILSAFVIFTESERWKNLTGATKGEVGQIKELWLWSKHCPENIKHDLRNSIKKYLGNIIEGGLHQGEGIIKSSETEVVFDLIHDNIYQLSKENPRLMTEVFKDFTQLMKYREERIHFVSFCLPKLLKNTLLFSAVLLIVGSFLIGVRNIWLDFIFVLSIANLVNIIYLLVDDMDNPTRAGDWHLTTNDYQELLNKIKGD